MPLRGPYCRVRCKICDMRPLTPTAQPPHSSQPAPHVTRPHTHRDTQVPLCIAVRHGAWGICPSLMRTGMRAWRLHACMHACVRRTCPLLEVHLSLLAHQVGEPPAHAADGGHGVHDLLLAIHVCVQQTQNVLKVITLHEGAHFAARSAARRAGGQAHFSSSAVRPTAACIWQTGNRQQQVTAAASAAAAAPPAAACFAGGAKLPPAGGPRPASPPDGPPLSLSLSASIPSARKTCRLLPVTLLRALLHAAQAPGCLLPLGYQPRRCGVRWSLSL